MEQLATVTPAVLSIGATEPWNAAGLGLDVRALAACGTRALTVVTGVTAQDRGGVRGASAVAPELIAAQFASLAEAEIGAVRIGALLDVASVRAVADWLRARADGRGGIATIYDPVFGPSGGGAFGDDATVATISRDLVPLATLVTPNTIEAARLTATVPATSVAAMEANGRALRALGTRAALITGGHLAGDPVDVLVSEAGTQRFADTRLAGTLRGTGCLLACGIAAAFAREPATALDGAIASGRAFVRACFANAIDVAGMRVAF